MFFTSPVGVGVGSEELMAVDFAIAHFGLPAVCETPLFGFHEITGKVDDGSDVLIGGIGGVSCQHSDSIGDIRSSGHHEIHELTDGRLEGPD